jgi:hypothetical protein
VDEESSIPYSCPVQHCHSHHSVSPISNFRDLSTQSSVGPRSHPLLWLEWLVKETGTRRFPIKDGRDEEEDGVRLGWDIRWKQKNVNNNLDLTNTHLYSKIWTSLFSSNNFLVCAAMVWYAVKTDAKNAAYSCDISRQVGQLLTPWCFCLDSPTDRSHQTKRTYTEKILLPNARVVLVIFIFYFCFCQLGVSTYNIMNIMTLGHFRCGVGVSCQVFVGVALWSMWVSCLCWLVRLL